MPFGFVVQGTSVLFRTPPSSGAIARALREWQPTTDFVPGSELDRWFVPFRPEVNGLVRVDVFDAPWPDGLGSPSAEPEIFASWGAGAFGPFAYPGGLSRALAVPSGDERAHEHVAAHRSVVRINPFEIRSAS